MTSVQVTIIIKYHKHSDDDSEMVVVGTWLYDISNIYILPYIGENLKTKDKVQDFKENLGN